MAENNPQHDVASVMGLVDTFLRKRAYLNQGNRSYIQYHPSEWASCLRKQQYSHYVSLGYIEFEEEPEASQKIRLFDKGHKMHQRWQEDYFGEMGVLKGKWRCTNPCCLLFDDEGGLRQDLDHEECRNVIYKSKTRIYGLEDELGCFKPYQCVCGNADFEYSEISVVNEELNMAGHVDLILDFSNVKSQDYEEVRQSFNINNLPNCPVVADMKTINDRQWKTQLAKYGPHKKYIVQVNIYMYILGLDVGLIIYENKNDSSVAAYKVERNDDIINTVIEQSKKMQDMSGRKLLPPPKPETKNDIECKYCSFKEMCHASKVWENPSLPEVRQNFYKNLL